MKVSATQALPKGYMGVHKCYSDYRKATSVIPRYYIGYTWVMVIHNSYLIHRRYLGAAEELHKCYQGATEGLPWWLLR